MFAEIALLSAMGVALFLLVALAQRLLAPWTLRSEETRSRQKGGRRP